MEVYLRNLETRICPENTSDPQVPHLYLVSVEENTVLYEAVGFLPAALQSVEVEVIQRAVIQADSNPRTPVVS